MRLIGLLFLALISTPGFSHAMTLEDVEAKLLVVDVLRSSYRQTRYVSGLSAPLESSGNLLLARGNGLAWMQEKPFQVVFVFTDGKIVESFPNQLEKITHKVDNPQVFQFINLLTTIFSGDKKLLEKYFDLQFASLDNARWKIILIPQKSRLKRIFKSVQLRGRKLVEDVTVYEVSGNRTTIDFYDITTEPKLLSDEERRYFQN